METEAKFIVPDEATFAELRDAEQLGPYLLRDKNVKQTHDRYMDTGDHRFYDSKFYLRLRELSDGSTLLTLKRLGGVPDGAVHSRDEYQTEVPGPDLSSWPDSEVKGMVEEIAGEQPLSDLVTVDQTRTVSYLYQDERRVAECSLDEIILQTPGEPAHAYEMEVEILPEGLTSDLSIVSGVLTERYNLAPQPLSKFERALRLTSGSNESDALAGGDPRSHERQEEAMPSEQSPADTKPDSAKKKGKMGVLPTDSMEAAGQKMLASYLKAMLSNEEGTRKGDDIEAVHDMRVATRRMRAVLRVMEPYFDQDAAGQVGRGLRSVTRALGAVRDLDVLIENAEMFRDTLPDDQQSDLNGLLADWASERERQRKRLIRQLNSKDYARLRKRIHRFVERDDTTHDENSPVEPYQVRHAAGSAILMRYEAVRAFETVMTAPSVDQLHELRIKGKYLRYTLECFRETLPSDSTSLISDVTKMQDQLGELHDADVTAALIREHLDQNYKSKKKADKSQVPQGLAAYLAEREDAVKRIHSEFSGTWETLSSPDWRSRLAAGIAAL